MIDRKLIFLGLVQTLLVTACDNGAAGSTADDVASSDETGPVCDDGGGDSCVCVAPEDVCVAPDGPGDKLNQTCFATVVCRDKCDPPYCPGDLGGEGTQCEADHAAYFETATQECIDLLAAAEECYIGMTCEELTAAWASPCDPVADPCTPHWITYSTAGCNYMFYPFSPNCA